MSRLGWIAGTKTILVLEVEVLLLMLLEVLLMALGLLPVTLGILPMCTGVLLIAQNSQNSKNNKNAKCIDFNAGQFCSRLEFSYKSLKTPNLES